MGREVYRETHRVVVVETVPPSPNKIRPAGVPYRPKGALSPVIDAIVNRIKAEEEGTDSSKVKGPSIGRRLRLFDRSNGQTSKHWTEYLRR